MVEKIKDGSGNLFARKIFSPAAYIPIAAHEQLRKRFRREVGIQQELGGQEIMPILEADLIGASPSFIMPLAENTYDKQILTEKTSGSVDINAIAEILNALEYIHSLGYVHRDLNPKNILKHNGHWKLSDFGAVLPPSGHTVTLTGGTVIYTEQYCAPEQRSGFHNAQSSADVFSFGCILHDIFGKPPRLPYSKVTAAGPVGHLIEKCTDALPAKRPSVKILRPILLDTLVEIGGHCEVTDPKSGEWLSKFDSIKDWKDTDFEDFGRFFADLDVNEREDGHRNSWVFSLSTPFLTRIPSGVLGIIAAREDGTANAIIEKYCDWVCSTEFDFHYVDTVSLRLTEIFDNGDASVKAMSLVSLVRLGYSHNRYYVMRLMLRRCSADALPDPLGRRVSIELKMQQLESDFKSCFTATDGDAASLCPELQKFIN